MKTIFFQTALVILMAPISHAGTDQQCKFYSDFETKVDRQRAQEWGATHFPEMFAPVSKTSAEACDPAKTPPSKRSDDYNTFCNLINGVLALKEKQTADLIKYTVDQPIKIKGVIQSVTTFDEQNPKLSGLLKIGSQLVRITPVATGVAGVMAAQKAAETLKGMKMSTETLIVETTPARYKRIPLALLSDKDREIIRKRLLECKFTPVPIPAGKIGVDIRSEIHGVR